MDIHKDKVTAPWHKHFKSLVLYLINFLAHQETKMLMHLHKVKEGSYFFTALLWNISQLTPSSMEMINHFQQLVL